MGSQGTTDWHHLKRACHERNAGTRIAFQEIQIDWGDDQLFKQCVALARAHQSLPTIFIFDRDKDDIVKKVEDCSGGYKNWGNNVFSFALPVPNHREGQAAICIEFYYFDEELKTTDSSGRRLFISSEFNVGSGRHSLNSNISVGNKTKLAGNVAPRIIDSEVYDERSHNIALSKADFAKNVTEEGSPFGAFRFEQFRPILEAVDAVIEHSNRRDIPFGGLDEFLATLEQLDAASQFCSIVDAAIRACKLTSIAFPAPTLPYSQQRILNATGAYRKKPHSIT